MQETLALGAIVLSLLSYVLAAIGPSALAPGSIAVRPLEIATMDEASTADFTIDLGAAGPGPIARLDWPGIDPPWETYRPHLSPFPLANGRVEVTWLSGSPSDHGSPIVRGWPAAARAPRAKHTAAVQAYEDRRLRPARVLKRDGGSRVPPADPLSDNVLKRYRQYAGELADLRKHRELHFI